MSSDPRPHAAFIRARREALGLSQVELARAARITPAMVSRLESGQRRGRSPMLRALAEALNVPAAELLERAGYGSEAQYWRERQADAEQPDPIAHLRSAVHRLPTRPAVQAALLTVATELARDPDRDARARFERAVARLPEGSAASEQITALRDLLFDSSSGV
jgi:transcriptional regulator with XRE-family HTH domain